MRTPNLIIPIPQKSLDLKKGANSITFSLSSGVVACTARIFLWDAHDHIVVSDIDGTITKYAFIHTFSGLDSYRIYLLRSLDLTLSVMFSR